MSDENSNDVIEQDVAQDAGQGVAQDTEQDAGQGVAQDTAQAPAVEESSGIGWTPFFIYLAVWVVLCVGAVFLLRPAALEGGARWAPEYLYAIYAGIGMMAVGPLLSVVVWLTTRARRAKDARRGLFISAFVKGALVTFTGAVLWIVALYVLDLFTSGVIV